MGQLPTQPPSLRKLLVEKVEVTKAWPCMLLTLTKQWKRGR